MNKQGIVSCKIAAGLMSLSFERKLNLREQLALKTHLAVCLTCRNCYAQVKGLRKILPRYMRAVMSITPPRQLSLPPAARQRIMHALRAQSV